MKLDDIIRSDDQFTVHNKKIQHNIINIHYK
jgi:hypothetical protein